MAEPITEDGQQPEGASYEQADNGTRPQSETDMQGQQDTDWQAEAAKWKALSRKNEERAKLNADKASQYDSLQESQKSELERAQDEAEKWKSKYETEQRQALRAETAANNHVPIELLTADSQEELNAQVKRLLDWKKPTPPASSGVDTASGSGKPAMFTQAQISDPKFYHDHRQEILKAMGKGRIK